MQQREALASQDVLTAAPPACRRAGIGSQRVSHNHPQLHSLDDDESLF